jgi:peptide-methionine (S)-S-oxide reductase
MRLGKAFLLSSAAVMGLAAANFPAPALDLAPATNQPAEPAVLAGGCYWGMQAVFERLHGVLAVTAGYAGALADPAWRKPVKDGGKGHAEAVRIVYDPSRISYGTLLEVFFAVAHDPTELNRQAPDIGTQYRSAIFYSTEAQRKVAQAYIEQLTQAKAFRYPIVTQVTPLLAFYPAEEDQQHYVERHPDSLYVIENDLPKVESLERAFRGLIGH